MKTWEQCVEDHIACWSGKNKLSPFAYHCTDVHNAASILKRGLLLSRQRAEAEGVMKVDIASTEVIARTPLAHTSFVRLYFRPRTPTQYRNEGIRPDQKIDLHAHCPVPVYLIFDLRQLLLRPNTQVSDGNMGSQGVQFGRSPQLLSNIPFQRVYHTGGYGPEERREITFRRHAEVLVPDELDLRDLVAIGCRSKAEMQTLLHLSRGTTMQDKIQVVGADLFHREWFFVEDFHAERDFLVFKIHRSSDASMRDHELQVQIFIHETETGRHWQTSFVMRGTDYRLQLRDPPGRALVSILLERYVAAHAVLQFMDDCPF